MTASERQRATHVIVLGNEKGGSGKTTTAMHVLVGLMRMGFKVASIDLDARQRSLSRYVENRRTWTQRSGVDVGVPDHRVLARSTRDSMAEAIAEDRANFSAMVAELSAGGTDFLVVDCPGSDVPLARIAHAHADTLITPINDSLVDLDLLGQLEPFSMRLQATGLYTQMVWEQRQERVKHFRSGVDWIVLRTRLSGLADRNKKSMADALGVMSQTFGFRIAEGFGERVIFRYLFLLGLTVLDLAVAGIDVKLTRSHETARDEVRELLAALWLPRMEGRLERV